MLKASWQCCIEAAVLLMLTELSYTAHVSFFSCLVQQRQAILQSMGLRSGIFAGLCILEAYL